MILAHLSDLHLGFRGHGRRERGRDARERDVEAVLERAVRELVDVRPDAVVVTGDVFDRSDPVPSVLLSLSRALATLREGLPGVPVALLAGPRDLPLLPGEPGVLDLLETWPDVLAATTSPRSLHLGAGRLHLALVPHGALVGDGIRERGPAVAPDPDARFNVLAVHGRVARGSGRVAGHRPVPGLRVDPADWDYVALGGEHAYREVGASARYAGSLERVGWTPWTEALEEKGFVTVDLDGGRPVFHALPVRPVVALAPIHVAPGERGRLVRRVREVTEEVPGGVDGRIVRLRLQGMAPDDLHALQDGLLEDLRSRALHLGVGVEEGEGPARSAPDAVARLASLLEAEGADPAGAAALLPERVESVPPTAGPVPASVRVDGLGVRIPTGGLVALVGREPRERTALGRALRESVGEDVPGPAGAAALLETAARRISGPGLEAIEAALERVRRGPPASTPVPHDTGLQRRDLEAAPRELRALERELGELRAEHVEVSGDGEQAAMEWTRERQDAETQLQTYRDRARELKARLRQIETAGDATPCPTCGRPLADHFEGVVAALRDDWESVVQDGRWWKRRREQLEEKPERLRELEGRAHRVHAAMEACSERVERVRARARELAGRAATATAAPVAGATERDANASGRATLTAAAPAGDGSPEASPTARALVRLRDERLADGRRRALLRASRVVEQVTGGRAVFLSLGPDGAPLPQGASGPLDDPAGEEGAAVRLALRAVAASARPGATLLLPEGTLEALAATDALRAVDVLRGLLRSVPRVLVVGDGRVVDRRPEAFDHAIELEGEGAGARARPLRVGAGLVVLAG